MHQILIEEQHVLLAFNPQKAYIQQLNSEVRFADVVVQVPRQAKAIDEVKKTTAYDEKYELFEEYKIGIWRYKRAVDKLFGWEEAEELCKQARDRKEPVPIRLHIGGEFIPENVVQYL